MQNDKIIQIRKLSQQYAYSSIKMHETIARRAGFSATDHKYLGLFLQKGSLTAGDLAELTGLTTGAVTGLIDRFEKKKLIKRVSDKRDRRKVVIEPNVEKITALLSPYYQTFQEHSEHLIASFSRNEQDIIESYLIKALALSNETNNRLKI